MPDIVSPYKPKHKIRIVTAANLFDGHDAATPPRSPKGEVLPTKSTNVTGKIALLSMLNRKKMKTGHQGQNGEMSSHVRRVLLGLPVRNAMKAGMTGVWQGRYFYVFRTL